MKATLVILSILLIIISNASAANIKFVEKMCHRYSAKNCNLVKAIVFAESSFRNITILDSNNKLSYGMGQIQCDTARMVGLKHGCEQLKNPVINMRFTIAYLNRLYDRYGLVNGAASYNSGKPIICKRHNKGRCYPGEFFNQSYVIRVMRKYNYLSRKETTPTDSPIDFLEAIFKI